MKLFGALGAILVICATAEEDSSADEGRSLRDYNQDWRAMDQYSPYPDSSGWIPHEEQVPQRRRIRKRKRRPPVVSLTEEQFGMHRKKQRPQRLDEVKEPWEMSDDDITQKSYSRRRLTPVYDATEEVSYEKIRDPFIALQEAEEKQKTTVDETTSAPDLKTLLKQSGGLSLSEVLQQRNLTLSELLSGDKKAISALASETTTDTVEVTTESKYRRLPPSFGLKKEFERHDQDLTSHEVMEAQRKRLSLLKHKDNKLFSDVTKVDVVTEETTEKRIFVPFNPTTSKFLPMTSAKLNRFKSEPTSTNGLEPNETLSSDGPLKMTIDLGEVTTRKTKDVETDAPILETTTLPFVNKSKQATAKEEIMEILRNPSEREHLARILRMRNMTVEELVQQRERGSSQLHLADIFHNKTREPEPKEEPFVGHIHIDNFESFPVFHRKPKTMPVKEDLSTTTKLPYTITNFPTYKIETNKDHDTQPLPPFWKQLFPLDHTELVQPSSTTTEKTIYHDLETIEDIENTLAEAANGDPDQEVYDEEGFIRLPAGVKSAILASLAIIGLSLLVFLTILVIFKWTQKQKRLKYDTPIMENDPKRTFRNFVSETLGRKKNYYKAHLQSMSDSIWDSPDKKPYMI